MTPLRGQKMCRRYDAIWPDEAPAGWPPEPPPWLMASTGNRPSWQSPVAGCCQDVPGGSSYEHLLRGGNLAGHGPAGVGGQHPDRGARGASGRTSAATPSEAVAL